VQVLPIHTFMRCFKIKWLTGVLIMIILTFGVYAVQYRTRQNSFTRTRDYYLNYKNLSDNLTADYIHADIDSERVKNPAAACPNTGGQSAVTAFGDNLSETICTDAWIDSTGDVGTGEYNLSTVYLSDGSAANPSLSFISSPKLGFYRRASTQIGISIGGAEKWYWDASYFSGSATGAAIISNVDGTYSSPAYRFVGDGDTGMFRRDANRLGFSTAAKERFSIYSDGTVGINDAYPDGMLDIVNISTEDLLMLSSGIYADGDVMIVKNNGNVGIGTTTPSQKLTVIGNLNVTGNIYNLDTYAYASTNETLPAPVAGVWYNISFKHSLEHLRMIINENNDTATTIYDGGYDMYYDVSIIDASPAPNAHVAVRFLHNGIEMENSYKELDTRKQNALISLTKLFHIDLEVGDNITLEYISSDTDVTVQQHGTYTDDPHGSHSATAYIRRIHP